MYVYISTFNVYFTLTCNWWISVIAKRRIGHTAEEVRDFILATDLDGLLPEYCELLLKFIPTKEEVKKLMINQIEGTTS